jgi:hypothetical protein
MTAEQRRLMCFRPWLAAAALYNVAWGAMNAVNPDVLLGPLGLGPAPVAWRVVGLLVGAYSIAYAWAAVNPVSHRHLILLGLLGKLAGVAGLGLGIAGGFVPSGYVFVVAANDVVWLPAFCMAARSAARISGGWRAYLAGR